MGVGKLHQLTYFFVGHFTFSTLLSKKVTIEVSERGSVVGHFLPLYRLIGVIFFRQIFMTVRGCTMGGHLSIGF